MSAPLYRDASGTTYTLDDLTVGEEDDRIATAADARALDALRVGEAHTIDLGACGIIQLERVE